MDTPVLIVGAGPTGLTLALWLTRFGVPFRIIDTSSGPGETSRAMGVQARTLEFYQQLGLAEEIIKRGIKVEEVNFRKVGRKVFSANLGDMGKGISPFPFMLSFPQDDHEKFLLEQLTAAGVTVERNTELTEFSQNDSGIQATVKTKNGEEKITAAYLCGCDGARSTVRTTLKVDFHGGTYSQIFYVADAMAEGDAANGNVQICVSDEDFCLVMPVRSSGTFRLIGAVPTDKMNDDKITIEDVIPVVEKDSGIKVKSCNWFSTYHVHHRVAKHFHFGRIFLSGDAAHIHSPVGAQGMNTGIGDAVNLAWKLAAVLQNRASPALLDTYEIERMAFAKQLVSTTDKLFQIMTNRGWLGKCWRGFVFPMIMPILFSFEFMRRFFFKVISQTKIEYRKSPLSKGVVNLIHSGDRLPWVDNTDNYAALKILDWQVQIYGKVNTEFENSLRDMHLTLTNFPWNEKAQAAGFQENAIYLVRPDGYISYVDGTQSIEGLKNFLTQYQITFRQR
jgi:2-polyprenyl-6-methoxyphenol hydroxylase-like FAD-dependent oxidoreductase